MSIAAATEKKKERGEGFGDGGKGKNNKARRLRPKSLENLSAMEEWWERAAARERREI